MYYRTPAILISLFASTCGACPLVPSDGCSVCGDGKCVTTPDAMFQFEDDPPVTCGDLQELGYTGEIPLEQCPVLTLLVLDVCMCDVITTSPTTAPSATSALPSTGPVQELSQSPSNGVIVDETNRPTPIPTSTPTTAAPVTPAPITPVPIIVRTPAPQAVTSAPLYPTKKPKRGKKQPKHGKKRALRDAAGDKRS